MLPGSNLEGIICLASPTGDSYVIATPDGRIRTYDAGSGRLRANLGGTISKGSGTGTVENGHLTEVHTCLCWVTAKDPSSKKKSTTQGMLLAAGTATGDVKLYNASLGELSWRASKCIEGGVSSMVCDSEQGILYCTGTSRQICGLHVLTGEVHCCFDASKYPITSMGLSPDRQHILGGGSTMQLWNITSQQRVAKYTGHPSDVRAVAFVPSGSHAVSAAKGERHVAIWDVSQHVAKKPKKQHPAVCTLSCDDPVVQLDTCCASAPAQGDAAFLVAALTETGEAVVWRCLPQQDRTVQSQLLAMVRVGLGTTKGAMAGKQECILTAKLQTSSDGANLLIARGSTAKPAFEQINIPQDAATEPATISLAPSGGALLGSSRAATDGPVSSSQQQQPIKASKAAAPAQQTVTVLGADNLGEAVLMRTVAAHANGPLGTGKKRPAEDVIPAEPVQAAFQEEEVPDLPQDEVPLGERLAKLEERAGVSTPTSADDEAAPGSKPQQGEIKADSLSVLLTQALRSNDRLLLERCLANKNPSLINNTIARIVPVDAASFLKAAVDRLLSRPNRAVQLVPWIQATLHHHTGYLMTAPAVQSTLTSLFQVIEARVKLHEPLLKIFGRLTLISHHTHRSQQADAEPSKPGPEVVFEDNLDDEPVAEDPFNPVAVSDDEVSGSEEYNSDDEDEGEGEDGSMDYDAMLEDGDGADDFDLDDF